MIIVTVVVVVDDDTYYWVYMSCDNCYCKVRQLFYYKVRLVLLQSAIGITKCDRTPSCLRYFFFFSGFILVLRTRLAEFILETNYLSRRIIRLEFDENLCRYFTRVAKI